MFKVPDWEDVPKTNINLKKKAKNPKKQHYNGPTNTNTTKTQNKHIPTTMTPARKLEENKNQPKKRKLNGLIANNKKKKTKDNEIDISNIDTDKIDEILLDVKKKEFYEPIERDDKEEVLFREVTKKPAPPPVKLSSNGKTLSKIIDKKTQKSKTDKMKKKAKQILELENVKPQNVFKVQENNTSNTTNTSQSIKKKQKIKSMLQTYSSNRNSITVTGNKLRERMLDRLKAAQFRYINEKLYTSSGAEAKELFQSDPAAFSTYHQGYQQQLKKWPVNPLDVIAKRIQKMPKTHTIADMGCGEAALSKRVPHKVRSFDLVSTAPGVEICDMAHTPLLAESMDVAVYCLALMGTELTQYLAEANRVLKMGGHLLIAEVESRFDDVDAFTKEVMKLGFKLKNLDKKHKVFFFMEFVKVREPPTKKSKLPVLTLKPCLYKRR